MTPPGVVNALVETGFAAGPIVLIGAVLSLLRRGTAAQVGRLDRFHVDHVVLTDQRERAGVMKVGALAPHMLMLFGEQLHRLLAAAAALLPFGYPLLRFLHLALGCAGVPGMLNELPVRRDEEHLQPHVDAGRFASEGQWLGGHLGTREADVPPIRLLGDGDGLGSPVERPGPADSKAPDRAEDQLPILQAGASAELVVGEGVVAVLALEPGKARLFSMRQAAEEGLVRLLEAGQHVLQDMAMDAGVLWHLRAQGFQLGFLLIAREADVAALPGGDALFQGGGRERAAAPQDALKLALLGGRRPQLLLLRLAHARLTQGYFSLLCRSCRARYCRSAQISSPLRERPCSAASWRIRSMIASGYTNVLFFLVGGWCSIHVLY